MTADNVAGGANRHERGLVGRSSAIAVPPPPPGPGVQPPFVAPPTDGARQRRWLAIGLVSGFLVLVCIGGLVGLGTLVVLGTQVVRDQATAKVTEYLTAVRDGEFMRAYSLLCDERQARQTEREFVNVNLGGPRVRDFTVGSAELSDDIRVPATIRYVDGTTDTVDFVLAQDGRTGDVEVCEVEG